MLASLNHPNICAIYGIEESNGIRFLILELVEGETLADKLAACRVHGRTAEGCRSMTCWTSRGKSPRPSKSRTTRGSFTAT